MSKVGIILVNYKDYAKKYLAACRTSLLTQKYSDFTVYLIDNASSPESLSYLRELYPEAIILPREDGNYCAANNLGMERAILDGCEYLVAANMDTEFDPDWLNQLVLALENNQDAAIAQSLILLYPKNESDRSNPKINTTGNLIHFLFFGFTNHYNLDKAKVKIEEYSDISYASGCSFIVRAKIFKEIGGYDEDLYMYHDDLDFSLRAKLAGYRVIIAPQSLVWHKYEFERSVRMLYYMERNRGLTFFSFYPLKTIIFLFPTFLLMSLGMTIFALKSGWLKTKIKVDLYFLKPSTWKLIKENRKKYQRLGANKLSEISQPFLGKINFQEIDNPILKYFVNPTFNIYWWLIKKII